MKEDIFNSMNEYKDRKNIPIKETNRYEDGVSLDENNNEKDLVDDSYKTYGEKQEIEIKDESILNDRDENDEKIGLEVDRKAGVTHVSAVNLAEEIEETDEGLDIEGKYNKRDFLKAKDIKEKDLKRDKEKGEGKDNLKTRSKKDKERDKSEEVRKFLGKDY